MRQELLIVDSTPKSAEVHSETPLAVAIGAWLDNKRQRSDSPRTERAYQDTLVAFRQSLQQNGLDLDSPGDLTGYLQVWAGTPGSKRDRHGRIIKSVTISRATWKHRLAVVSSFYRFAARRQYLHVPNPADGIERGKKAKAYAKAQPLKADDVKCRLAAIDQTMLAGKRDYALLQLAVNTGRRRAELAGLRWGDLHLEGEQILITWQRTKGGDPMADTLNTAVSAALLRYLRAVYGADLARLPHDAPVWVALAPPHAGHALTPQAIANICLAHLETSKVHTTRHTFAHVMQEAGATVTEIRDRLGHKDLATTNTYLAALTSAENPHAEHLAALFGAE